METVSWQLYEYSRLSRSLLTSIFALRQMVFVVEQNCPYLDIDGQDLQAFHLCGFAPDGQLVAYARLFPGRPARFGRVIVDRSWRGQGLGRQLCHQAIVWLETLSPTGTTIEISAQSYLLEFYQSLGFVAVGESYEEDGIPHIRMLRESQAAE